MTENAANAKKAGTAVTARPGNTNLDAFTSRVMLEFNKANGPDYRLTEFQKNLVYNYFIGIDRTMVKFEEDRIRKNASNADHKFDNPDPLSWKTIDAAELAISVMRYARMGIDMSQKNMLSAIPFKNNNRVNGDGQKIYTMNLMPGYAGIQYIAMKYALDPPKNVTVELVRKNDRFRVYRKSKDREVESYDFEEGENAFDRGDVVGGFGYIEYEDPTKNKLVVMSLKDILKRKPKKASAEFWGGTVTRYDGGKKVTEDTDGWFDEMCLKTVKREVYSEKHIPRDPKKIDDDYRYARLQEVYFEQQRAGEIVSEDPKMIDVEEADAALSGPSF